MWSNTVPCGTGDPWRTDPFEENDDGEPYAWVPLSVARARFALRSSQPGSVSSFGGGPPMRMMEPSGVTMHLESSTWRRCPLSAHL